MAQIHIETIYGRRNKYEIFRKDGWSTKFYVRINNDRWTGYFNTLAAAMDWVRERG